MTEDFRNTAAEIDDSNPVNTLDPIQKKPPDPPQSRFQKS